MVEDIAHKPLGRISQISTQLAYLVTALAIMAMWMLHLPELGAGEPRHWDEYHTYERALGFDRYGDWFTVYTENRPSVRKPPLQYWMSAALMQWGVEDMLALRLPSMLYALLGLIGVAFLTRVLAPSAPWAMAAAVILLGASPQYWELARSAMLDSGASMFVTLGFAFMVLAFREPRYWYAFACVAVLGALQKAPASLAFLLFSLISLWLTRGFQTSPLRSITSLPQFKRAFWITAIASFAWPIGQVLRYIVLGIEAHGNPANEMVRRFIPSLSGRDFEELGQLILVDEPLLRVVGILCLFALPFITKTPRYVALTGIFVFFVIFVFFAYGSVFSRYSLLVLPLLMASIAVVISHIIRNQLVAFACVGLLAVGAGWPVRNGEITTYRESAETFGVPLAELFAPVNAALLPTELFFHCTLNGPKIPVSAIAVYLEDRRPFVRSSRMDIDRRLRFNYLPEFQSLRGLCREDEMEVFGPQLVDLQMQPIEGTDYVMWTASGYVTTERQ